MLSDSDDPCKNGHTMTIHKTHCECECGWTSSSSMDILKLLKMGVDHCEQFIEEK